MNLSEHFTLEEATFSSTAVRFCVDNTCPPELLDNMRLQAAGMELVRHALGDLPLHVDSWYRCASLNVIDKGAKLSDHLNGLATDFVCPAFGAPLLIARCVLASGIVFDKLIMEGAWVHISFNPLARGLVLTAHFSAAAPTTYTEGLPT